jgi:hypothetical protein
VLNRLVCRCAEKMLWPMNCCIGWSEIFFLANLCEVPLKCVIGFGRIVRILEDQSKC